jgi:hypothetical protein
MTIKNELNNLTLLSRDECNKCKLFTFLNHSSYISFILLRYLYKMTIISLIIYKYIILFIIFDPKKRNIYFIIK